MEARLSHLYLPTLEEDANVQEPTDLGHWQNNERRVLGQIARSIVVDEQARVRGVSSVPDVWARPLMVQSALRKESEHPLRERIVNEWRGLLSLLALREFRGHDVAFVPVRLDQGHFAQALRHLAPRPIELEPGQGYAWTDVLLIRYDGIPIGALSPTTLVYTGSDYATALRDTDLNLQQRDAEGNKTGRLGPPQEEEDLRYVAEWVLGLKKRLRDVLNHDDHHPDHRITGLINELLDDWLRELNATLGLDPRNEETYDARDVVVADDHVPFAPEWGPLDHYRVYQHLLRPLVPDEAAIPFGDFSDLSLDLDPTRNHSGYDEAVVITPRLLKDNPRVWRTKRFSHLGGDIDKALAQYFDGSHGTDVAGDPMLVKDDETDRTWRAFWIRPERYFLTDRLVRAPGAEPLLAPDERRLNEVKGGHFLLPFRRAILDFFGPEDIKERLKPEFSDVDNGVRFSFMVPVGGREERVERVYRYKDAEAGEGTIVEGTLPVTEVFPTYLGPDWRRYYLLQEDDGRTVVEPVVFGEPSVVRRTREVEEPQAGGGAGAERAIRRAHLTQITGDAAFPEGLAVQSAEGRPLGLVLLDRETAAGPGLAGTWRIGIDFGTSNTNVFRQSSESDRAEGWTFDFPATLRPITTGADLRRAALLEAFFVPARAVALPIPSTLRLFEAAQTEHPFLDYFIHFGTGYRLPAHIRSQLKWDQEQRNTKEFLESLFLLILIDAVRTNVAELRVSCSYPKAYSETQFNLVDDEWSRIYTTLLEGENRVFTPKPEQSSERRLDVRKPRYELEGVASGAFFASKSTITDPLQRADKANAALTLDVGGGTTDISVWHQNAIALDASILLAGKQVASYLANAPRVRELLFSANAAMALDEVVRNPKAFGARLNLILKQEEATLRDRLIEHVNRPDIRRLRQLLAVEFGAIAFYTAALVGAAEQTSEGRGILQMIGKSGIKMHWGGNAAKLITWIDLGTYKEDGPASKMLNAVFYQALKDLSVTPPSLAQLQSPGHKSEAAGGLVVMAAPGQAQNPTSTGEGLAEFELAELNEDGEGAGRTGQDVVSGENAIIGGDEVGYLDLIGNRSLFDGHTTRFESTSLDRLDRFVQVLNAVGTHFGLFPDDMRVSLDERRRTHIANATRTVFVENARLSSSARIIEPIFITEVKELIEMLIAAEQ
ncbi:MAG: hypothetical protein HKN04_03095 [Rhodothermaceae bacterium]|nr:hypothetical protein [Rhodothermaceae bacterium]